jgi:lysozyme
MDALTYGKLKAQLIRHEGLRKTAYRCSAGKLTIGFGHNLSAHGIPAWLTGRDLDGAGITEEEARRFLDEDIAQCVADLNAKLPALYNSLNPVRKAVLVNLCFNMGIGNSDKGLLSFKNTLAHMASGEFDKAADGMLASKWAKQVGKRAIELSQQMRKGEWQ